MFWGLPDTVRVRWTTAAHDGTATPEELASLGAVAPTRLAEFVTTRHLARQALVAAGGPAASLPVGADRAPVWPDGWTGSLTHCRGFRAAAVAPADEVAALGIDAEPASPLPPEVLPDVLSPLELRRCSPFGALGPTVVFSAKECLYKVWSPLTGGWLDLLDAEVVAVRRPWPDRGTVVLRPRGAAPTGLQEVRVRVAVTPDWVLTSVTVDRVGQPADSTQDVPAQRDDVGREPLPVPEPP